MIFEPTITFGALLQAAVLLAGFIVAFTKIGGRIDLLTARIRVVEENIKDQRDVNERLAVIEVRQGTHGQLIANLQTEMQDLRRGRGFIASELTGEWPRGGGGGG